VIFTALIGVTLLNVSNAENVVGPFDALKFELM
jgi:hypothetical protein